MLVKLKKEQSVKLKISIVFIWIMALGILANAIYDSYLMYIDEYEYSAFSFLPYYMHYVFMSFGVLIAIGLLVKSKVARWMILFFSYLPLVAVISNLLVYSSIGEFSIYMLVLAMGFYLLNIYLLSHEDIRREFKIKHLKWEIVSYFIFSVVLYLLFMWYMHSMTSEFDNEVVFESNSSVVVTPLSYNK